ncbi:19299_t:CDS:1, partial [Racocetra fulgida]
KHQKELNDFLYNTSKSKIVVQDKNKSTRSLLKESKYRNELVELNLSGGNFSNRFFEDNTVADLNKTELEKLNLDDEVLTDISKESSNSDYDNALK